MYVWWEWWNVRWNENSVKMTGGSTHQKQNASLCAAPMEMEARAARSRMQPGQSSHLHPG